MPVTRDAGPEPFRVLPAAALHRNLEHLRWLVEGLWSLGGVGLLGGPPKSCKSWLSLDLAISVASGTPCLGHFQVPNAGAVLVYMVEDAEHVVQERLQGICRHRKLTLHGLPLFFITEPRIRLDHPKDRQRLTAAVKRVVPRLLVLDPLVRMHGTDENDAGAVSALLAHLRELQRRFDLAIVLVHHTRKSGASSAHIGLSLRGSGDFHAWGDHNLYLRRVRGAVDLRLEHRATASPPDPYPLELVGDDGDTHLELNAHEGRERGEAGDRAADRRQDQPPAPSPESRVISALGSQAEPIPLRELRSQTRMRTQTLCGVLAELSEAGRVLKNDAGYRLAEDEQVQAAFPFPVSPDLRGSRKRETETPRGASSTADKTSKPPRTPESIRDNFTSAARAGTIPCCSV